jgi:Flp pilus assembly protein TadD
MKRKLVLWLIPAALLGASVPFYQFFIRAAPDRGQASDGSEHPQLMLSHASSTEREHEIKALKGQLEKNPDHLPILLRLAQVSRDSGKLNDSVGYLREAVTQNPKNAEANLELGRVLFETGDVGGAIRATEAVLEINPVHVDALYNLGAIYGNLSQDDRARTYWEKAVTIAPESESGRRAKENLSKLR